MTFQELHEQIAAIASGLREINVSAKEVPVVTWSHSANVVLNIRSDRRDRPVVEMRVRCLKHYSTHPHLRTDMQLMSELVCKVTGYDPTVENRESGYVTARMLLCHILNVKGYRKFDIGAVLGWSPSTITVYTQRMQQILDGPKDSREMRLWVELQRQAGIKRFDK